MNKKIGLVIVVLSIYLATTVMSGCTESSSSSIKWLDYNQGMKKANETGKPIILYFYANGDEYKACREMEKQLYKNSEIIEKSNNFVMIKVDINSENGAILSKYRLNYIPYVPTVIFLGNNRTELSRVIGYDYTHDSQSVQNFLEEMNNALKGRIHGDDFEFTTLNGSIKHLSDYRGKIVLIDLMATWCQPCRMQMQQLKDTLDHYGKNDDVVIISIDVEATDDVNKIKNTFSDHISEWTFARDTSGISSKYSVQAIPTLIIFDKFGRIVYLKAGLTSSQQLINIIDSIR